MTAPEHSITFARRALWWAIYHEWPAGDLTSLDIAYCRDRFELFVAKLGEDRFMRDLRDDLKWDTLDVQLVRTILDRRWI